MLFLISHAPAADHKQQRPKKRHRRWRVASFLWGAVKMGNGGATREATQETDKDGEGMLGAGLKPTTCRPPVHTGHSDASSLRHPRGEG